jgi:short-subunit dehydrogenase
MPGKISIITGATSGIGRAAAHMLAAPNEALILVGRNERAGVRITRQLRSRTPRATIDYIRADLSVRSDVLSLATTIGRSHDHVDVLINNAGARNDDFTWRRHRTGICHLNHLGYFCSPTFARTPVAGAATGSSPLAQEPISAPALRVDGF